MYRMLGTRKGNVMMQNSLFIAVTTVRDRFIILLYAIRYSFQSSKSSREGMMMVQQQKKGQAAPKQLALEDALALLMQGFLKGQYYEHQSL